MLTEKGRIEVDAEPVKWVASARATVSFNEALVTQSVTPEGRELRFEHSEVRWR